MTGCTGWPLHVAQPTSLLRVSCSNERRQHIAYLSNLAVHPRARRRYIGEALVRQAEQQAKEWGCRTIALHVDVTNSAAIDLYTKMGYRQIGKPSSEHNTGAPVFEPRTLVLMMKFLQVRLPAALDTGQSDPYKLRYLSSPPHPSLQHTPRVPKGKKLNLHVRNWRDEI